MQELVVISGKGGTGKTSILSSFAVLAGDAVIADCDVDAADLHLVLHPEIERRELFRSGNEAVIRTGDCTLCGVCEQHCRFDAILRDERHDQAVLRVDPLACEGCGVCAFLCPEKAIDFPERVSGEWFLSRTRCGPMVHAKLGVAAENSGKLVTLVRQEARKIAQERGKELILVDGPPGIGCAVISSITESTGVLVVTEPTESGAHDMERVLRLADHFHARTAVCVNKWDLHPQMADRIEESARRRGAAVAGRVRYDPAVTTAQVQRRSTVELGGSAAQDIRALWQTMQKLGFVTLPDRAGSTT